MFSTWVRVIPLVVAVLLLDQATKSIVTTWLVAGRELVVFEYFSIILSHNAGIAFGFFQGAQGLGRIVLLLVILAVTVWVVFLIHTLKPAEQDLMWPLAYILAGALGNGYDRIARGEVVDFLAVHYEDWYFPTFNFADVAISLGVVLLLINMTRRAWPT